jgi:hypothetical protein
MNKIPEVMIDNVCRVMTQVGDNTFDIPHHPPHITVMLHLTDSTDGSTPDRISHFNNLL